MAKNIIILSDGTGQRGGLFFDESRSNIYKLYRATRCGPDSSIDPAEQLAFYDPGIGSTPGGLGALGQVVRWLYNLVCKATGLGLTLNIIDCYVAILKLWRPGDRIFLFGFSRGAYTVRCLAAVLVYCGIPTTNADGSPLLRNDRNLDRIANEAVKKVYQHVSSPKDAKFQKQRLELAARFRARHRCADAPPHLVGVFDTVASLARPDAMVLVSALFLIAASVIGGLIGFLMGSLADGIVITLAFSISVALIALLVTNVKFATGLPGFSFWETFHFTYPWMRFLDMELSDKVAFARHALSIDEDRKAFDCVIWSNERQPYEGWLEQVWFAGDHADIGGGYAENESRLSDIAMQWMVEQAQGIPSGLKVDREVLRLYPDALGQQHDERKAGLFRLGGVKLRSISRQAHLHLAVLRRFEAPAVLQYDEMKPYRPEALRHHEAASGFYRTAEPPAS